MSVRYVSLSPIEAFRVIEEKLTEKSMTTELVASHIPRPTRPGERESVVGVFERYTFRMGNRMTLTVLCSPMKNGTTEVFFAAAGASNGIFLNDDFGAADKFEAMLLSAIEPYLCREGES